MKKKTKITLLSATGLSLILVAGATFVAASNVPWNANDPMAGFFASMTHRSKNPAQTLNDIAGQAAARKAWENMPPEQQQKAFDASNAKFQADMKARLDAQGGPKQLNTPFNGITNQVDPAYSSSVFNQLEGGWEGHSGGVDTVIVSGAFRADENQGVLVVEKVGSSFKNYNSPTATGPLKIISETGGILTLQSQAGTWETYDENTDTRSTVTTKGGVTYRFNTATNTWVK